MRIGYREDENFPGEFGLWQGNCARSLHGKAGQAALRELEAALLALPAKRLIADKLIEHGDVCAIGALALHKGATPEELELEDEEAMEDVGEEFGLPRLVAWKVVEKNDMDIDFHYILAPGPARWPNRLEMSGGYQMLVHYTPEERYEHVLGWVRQQLRVA